MGPPWSHLGAFWAALGRSWRSTGAPKELSRRRSCLSGTFQPRPNSSWPLLYPSWSHLAPSWAATEALKPSKTWVFLKLLNDFDYYSLAYMFYSHGRSISPPVHILPHLASPRHFPLAPRALEASSPRGASAGTRSAFN